MNDVAISTKSDQIDAVVSGLRQITTQLEQFGFSQVNEPLVASKVVADCDIVSIAERLIEERRKRDKFFDSSTFGEPVWDILLDLYVAQMKGRMISVSSACIGAHVAPTTALRHLTVMTEKGDVVRIPDSSDARRVYVQLSDEKIASMTEYLSTLTLI
jgi:DNA-binding MarR family transcriptional regulator